MKTSLLEQAQSSDSTGKLQRTSTRVCHVSLTLRTGGLERLLVEYARRHDQARFELEFVTLTDAGTPAEDIERAECRVWSLESEVGKLKKLRALVRIFRERQFDVVHTHNPFPHIYASIAAKCAGTPVVIQTRHGRHKSENWKQRLLYGTANLLSDEVVAVSDDAAELCSEFGPLDANKITRIWNGIDIDRFDYHGPLDCPHAISVGRLVPEKDFATLLEAIPMVLTQLPDFRLRIVGSGPERANLEQIIEDQNLQEAVELLGERQDVPDLLASSGLYISSSVTEGISLTLLEAMAVGLPTIATRVGGSPEIVADGQTGYIVEPSDATALAQAIVRLCKNSRDWRDMGEAGRRRVERHFSIEGMISKYEDLYVRALSRRGVART